MARLGACDADGAGKGCQWNFDAGCELGNLAFEIEVKVFDLSLGKLAGKLPEHAGHIEVGAVGARHDLVDPDFENVARFRALDVDRTGQRVRSSSGEIGPQFLDLFDRGPGHHLVM